MSDRHAYVTRDVTSESQYPVPTRPDPTRPALYKSAWSPSHHGVALVTRGAAAPAPAATHDVMMDEVTSDGHIRCAGVGCIRPTHDADFIVGFHWPHGHRYQGARCMTWWLRDAPVYCLVAGCTAAGEDRDSVCRIVEVLS